MWLWGLLVLFGVGLGMALAALLLEWADQRSAAAPLYRASALEDAEEEFVPPPL